MQRLRWLFLVLYILLVAGLLALGLAGSGGWELWLFVAGSLLTQVLFLVVRGNPQSLRPVRSRHLVLPAIMGGLMMAVLIGGLSIALMELAELEGRSNVVVPIVLLGMWVLWAIVFCLICRPVSYLRAVRRILCSLVAGSILQLMATIPSHFVVSRRPGCLVGMGTALGITAGLYVLIWSFGPGIFLLFMLEVRKRHAGHCPSCGYNLFGLSQQRCPECGEAFTFEEVGMTAEQLGFRRSAS